MRSDNITFADLTKVYNEIYSSSICQSTISRDCRKIINIFDKGFFEFLKQEHKREIKFLMESLNPLREGKTRFDYKTYCFILASLICVSGSNDNLIDTVRKKRNHIEEYKFIDFFHKIINFIPKIIEISSKNYKDNPKNEKKIKRALSLKTDLLRMKRISILKKDKEKKVENFKNDLQYGFDMVINIYDLLDRYYRKKIENKINKLFLKISCMSYESKANLINILEKNIENEINRTRKRKINKNDENQKIQKKLDEIENSVAMKTLSEKQVKEANNNDGSLLCNLEKIYYEYE